MDYFYVIDFVIYQTLVYFYVRYLTRNEITPGSIAALGAVILFELVLFYHLLTKQTTTEVIYKYTAPLFS